VPEANAALAEMPIGEEVNDMEMCDVPSEEVQGDGEKSGL